MIQKMSPGDRALVWGNIIIVLMAGVSFTSWVSRVDMTATNAAQAQEKDHDAVLLKLDALNLKVDRLSDSQARIEGALGVSKHESR